MTRQDLSPTMQKAYDLLPESEKAKFLKEQEQLRGSLIRAAICQVSARNQSHGLGKHVLKQK